MSESRLNDLLQEDTTKRILTAIPNELGINLCSVEDIIVNRLADGQIKDIQIKFYDK